MTKKACLERGYSPQQTIAPRRESAGEPQGWACDRRRAAFLRSVRYVNKCQRILREKRNGSWISLVRSVDRRLTSACPVANVVLENAYERIIVDDVYGDIPLGVYVIRGENIVIMGEVVSLSVKAWFSLATECTRRLTDCMWWCHPRTLQRKSRLHSAGYLLQKFNKLREPKKQQTGSKRPCESVLTFWTLNKRDPFEPTWHDGVVGTEKTSRDAFIVRLLLHMALHSRTRNKWSSLFQVAALGKMHSVVVLEPMPSSTRRRGPIHFLLPPPSFLCVSCVGPAVLRCAVQRTIVSHACLHRSILGSRCRFRGSKLAGTIRFRWIGWVPFQKGFVASYSQLKWNRVDRSLAADEFRKHRRDRDVFVTRCERPGAHSGCFDSGKAYRRRIRRRRGREKVGGRRCIRSRAVQVDRWSVTEGQDEETKRRKATTPWRTKWTFITRNSMT